jgi:recombinational DNA repair protein (RecF pathway)
LLVSILNQKRVKTLYRFYGARHSHIQIGYKIDYEAHPTNKENLFQLRSVSHLPFKWILQRDRFYIWQQFLKLLYSHLKDVDEVGGFYFDLLEDISRYLEKENPKRVMIESYSKILEYEGRIHNDFNCFMCGEKLDKSVCLVRSYVPACQKCVAKRGFLKKKVEHFFRMHNSILFDADEVEELYATMLEGF